MCLDCSVFPYYKQMPRLFGFTPTKKMLEEAKILHTEVVEPIPDTVEPIPDIVVQSVDLPTYTPVPLPLKKKSNSNLKRKVNLNPLSN